MSGACCKTDVHLAQLAPNLFPKRDEELTNKVAIEDLEKWRRRVQKSQLSHEETQKKGRRAPKSELRHEGRRVPKRSLTNQGCLGQVSGRGRGRRDSNPSWLRHHQVHQDAHQHSWRHQTQGSSSLAHRRAELPLRPSGVFFANPTSVSEPFAPHPSRVPTSFWTSLNQHHTRWRTLLSAPHPQHPPTATTNQTSDASNV